MRGLVRLRRLALKKTTPGDRPALCKAPVQVRRSFLGWKGYISKRKMSLGLLTPASRALRTWRRVTKYFRQRLYTKSLWQEPRFNQMLGQGMSEADEMAERLEVPEESDLGVLKAEYTELRDLADHTEEVVEHGRHQCEMMRIQIRLDLAAAVEGATWHLNQMLLKLIERRRKHGITRIKFFSGGPGLVESKIMITAIGKQMAGLAVQTSQLTAQNRHLEEGLRKHKYMQLDFNRVAEETVQTEEDLSKVDARLHEQHVKNEKLRAQLQKAIDEKQRLVSILRQAV